MEARNLLYDDETRMRKIVQEQILPVVSIAKENMINNAYKNEELKQTQEDLIHMMGIQEDFKRELTRLEEFKLQIIKLKSDLMGEIHLVEQQFLPIKSDFDGLKQQQNVLEGRLRDLAHEQLQHKTQVQDVKNFVLEQQENTKLDFQSELKRMNQTVAKLDPRFDKLLQFNMDYISQIEKNKHRIETLEFTSHELQKKQFSLLAEINHIQEMDLAEINKKIAISLEITHASESSVKRLDKKFVKFQNALDGQKAQNEFQQKLLPFIMTLMISDYMQEFLCAPDSLKLMKFDNKKLDDLNRFQMQCFDIDQFHQNLDRLRKMFTEQKKGVLRVNLIDDIIVMSENTANKIDQKQEKEDNEERYKQYLETVMRRRLINKEENLYKNFNLEKNIIKIKQRYRASIIKQTQHTKNQMKSAPNAQMLLKVNPVLRLGMNLISKMGDNSRPATAMASIDHIDHSSDEKIEKQKSIEKLSIEKQRSIPKSETHRVIMPELQNHLADIFQRLSNAEQKLEKIINGDSSDEDDETTHELEESLIDEEESSMAEGSDELQIQSQKQESKSKQEDEQNDQENDQNQENDQENAQKLQKQDNFLGKSDDHTKGNCKRNNTQLLQEKYERNKYIIDQVIKQGDEKNKKIQEQREEIMKKLEVLILNEIQCHNCGFKNSKVDNFSLEEEKRTDNAHFSYGYLGSGLPNTLEHLIYIRGQSKVDRFQNRFLTKKRNWLIRQFNPMKRYQNQLKKENEMLANDFDIAVNDNLLGGDLSSESDDGEDELSEYDQEDDTSEENQVEKSKAVRNMNQSKVTNKDERSKITVRNNKDKGGEQQKNENDTLTARNNMQTSVASSVPKMEAFSPDSCHSHHHEEAVDDDPYSISQSVKSKLQSQKRHNEEKAHDHDHPAKKPADIHPDQKKPHSKKVENKKKSDLKKKNLQQLQKLRNTYNRNLERVEQQIASMIIREQQLLQSSGLTKKSQAVKLAILEKQFQQQILKQTQINILDQLSSGLITKKQAKEMYEEKASRLQVKGPGAQKGSSFSKIIFQDVQENDMQTDSQNISINLGNEGMVHISRSRSSVSSSRQQIQSDLRQFDKSKSSSPSKVNIEIGIGPLKSVQGLIHNNLRESRGSVDTSQNVNLKEIQSLINKSLESFGSKMFGKFKKEITKEFLETLKMSRTEMMGKAKHMNQKVEKMIESVKIQIKENQTDTTKRFEVNEEFQQTLKQSLDTINVDFIKQMDIHQKIKSQASKQEKNIKDFMDKINNEYIEYFTGKKKMKSDIETQFNILSNRINNLNEFMSSQDSTIQKHRSIHQVLVETTNYLSALFSQDLLFRHKMANQLKNLQTSIPQDDQVIKSLNFDEKQKSSHMDRPKSKGIQISARVQYSSQGAERKKIKAPQLDDKGGLALQTLNYRNQNITSDQFISYLAKLNQTVGRMYDGMINNSPRHHKLNVFSKKVGIRQKSTESSAFDLQNSHSINEPTYSSNHISRVQSAIKPRQDQSFDTKKYELMPQKIFDDILFGKDPLGQLDVGFTIPSYSMTNLRPKTPKKESQNFNDLEKALPGIIKNAERYANREKYLKIEQSTDVIDQQPKIFELSTLAKIDMKSQNLISASLDRENKIKEEQSIFLVRSSDNSSIRKSAKRRSTSGRYAESKHSTLNVEELEERFTPALQNIVSKKQSASFKITGLRPISSVVQPVIRQEDHLQYNSRNIPMLSSKFNKTMNLSSSMKSQIQSLQSLKREVGSNMPMNIQSQATFMKVDPLDTEIPMKLPPTKPQKSVVLQKQGSKVLEQALCDPENVRESMMNHSAYDYIYINSSKYQQSSVMKNQDIQ